jgi:integrase
MKAKVKAGSIYKQKKSPYWWIKFYVPGRPTPIRESTKTEDLEEAQRYLYRRLGETAVGKSSGTGPERVKVNELFDLVVEDHESNGRASVVQLKGRLKNYLRPFFGAMRASQVGTRQIKTYIAKRQKDGAMNATINRELEHLRRAFKLGFEEEPKLVMQPLKVPRLEEDNIREMTITLEQYLILRNGLPEPYQTFFVCGYHLGTREGELIKLQWSEVDLDKNEILLKRYTTKSKKPRVLPIYGEMKQFLTMAKERRDRLYPDCPWVFNREGEQFLFLPKVWNNHVKRLGVPGLHFHDLRRTGVTNMINAGFTEKEAMIISGHKTDGMLRRYHIVKRERIQELGAKMEKYFQEQMAGILAGIPGAKGQVS